MYLLKIALKKYIELLPSHIFGLDKEIRKLVDEGYNQAKKILTEKIDDLHKIAKALITYETLTGEEIENIVNKNLYPKDKIIEKPGH